MNSRRNIIATVLLMVAMLSTIALQARERDSLWVGSQAAFEQNLGQWDSRVAFAAQLRGAALFLEDDGITIALQEIVAHPAPYNERPLRNHAYKMRFPGCKSAPTGEAPLPGYSNYFIGGQENWRSRVQSFAVARYKEIYHGVDMEVYCAAGGMKYNFIVSPQADARLVEMEYIGADEVWIDRRGNLNVRTSVRDIVELKPYAFQREGSKEREVPSRWRVKRSKEGYLVSVEVEDYDRRKELVIDPTLIFSSYTGSTADNWGTTATFDSHKNTYTAGLVFNIGYPVSLGAYDNSFNGMVDIGIFKFDTSGSARLWATYLGGLSSDMPHSMHVDALDELLIFGTTGSTDFPTTTGAYQTQHAGGTTIDYEASSIRFNAGSDIFVCRFSADGTQLLASTLVGGSGNDGLNFRPYFNTNTNVLMDGNDSLYYNYGDGARGEIAIDDLGNVYVGSTTMSTDFPTTTSSIRPTWSGKQEGVVFKLDHNLRNMLWSTYLGGAGDDAVYSVDVDSSYNVVVCGGTTSSNFPVTAGAYQTTYGGGSADGFVCKISADGNNLLASTFIGKRFYDQLYFVRTGRRNEVFLYGQTAATGNDMIYNAGYSVYGAGMLLMRMEPDLSDVIWSTVFGTSGRINISPTAFAADICNRIYAAGWGRDFVGYNGVQWNTQGTTGMEITADAWQDTTDGQDFYIISLDADANQLEYATFFGEAHTNGSRGADHVDGGTSRFDRLATLYQSVCGSCGASQNFPTTASAWSEINGSANCNNAIFRFNVTDDFPVAEFNTPPVGCVPYTVSITNMGRGTSYEWDFGDGTTSTQTSPTHTYTQAGNYTITLIAKMPDGCDAADTQRHVVQVLDGGHFGHTPEIACNGIIQIGMRPALGATYSWTGDSVSDPTVANPYVSNDGTYILTTQADGCSQVDTFHVSVYTLVEDWTLTRPSCHDTADASLSFSIGIHVNPDSILIDIDPSAVVGTPIYRLDGRYGIAITGLAPDTTYTFRMTAHGCEYQRQFTVPNTPIPSYAKETSVVLCNDSCTGWIKISYSQGNTPGASIADTLLQHLCEGQYITNLVAGGCPFADTTLVVRNHTLDTLRVWADQTSIYLGESVGLHASTSDPGNAALYTWMPAADLNDPYLSDPIATPTDTLACYSVTATTTDGICSATGEVCIHCKDLICGAPEFFIPNAFTPNGDGINDRICFDGTDIVEFSIAIFNRWGECVYQSEDINECWDGTYNDHPCLPGVYPYTCHLRCPVGKESNLKGDITLIR